MKRWICLVLVLVMTAMLFAGCGEKKKLLGTWVCTVDLTEEVQTLLDGIQLGGEFSVSDFQVKATLEFDKDDRFRLQLDFQDLEEQLDGLVADLEKDLIALLQTQLGERLEISIEELLDMASIDAASLTEALREQFPVEDIRQALEEMTVLTGSYKVKKDKLLLGPDEDSLKIVPGIPYVLEEGVLELLPPEELDLFVTESRLLKALPLRFTKQ